jgi:hypothetical protein
MPAAGDEGDHAGCPAACACPPGDGDGRSDLIGALAALAGVAGPAGDLDCGWCSPATCRSATSRCRFLDDGAFTKLLQDTRADPDPFVLALVAGQDVEPAEGSDGTDGRWRIARKVAEARVISTVDTEARLTRKSPENRRDGYRAHVAAEPGTGLITDEAMTMAAAT